MLLCFSGYCSLSESLGATCGEWTRGSQAKRVEVTWLLSKQWLTAFHTGLNVKSAGSSVRPIHASQTLALTRFSVGADLMNAPVMIRFDWKNQVTNIFYLSTFISRSHKINFVQHWTKIDTLEIAAATLKPLFAYKILKAGSIYKMLSHSPLHMLPQF